MSLRSIRATNARYRCALFLRLQLPLVRSDEGANIVRHIEELEPLLLVEGHRKAAHAVDRDGSLLAHLEAKAGRRALLQRGIFPAQAFELSFDLFVGHGIPAILAWMIWRLLLRSSVGTGKRSLARRTRSVARMERSDIRRRRLSLKNAPAWRYAHAGSYGSSDATNAEIATMSSLLSFATTPCISGAQAPARSPVANR